MTFHNNSSLRMLVSDVRFLLGVPFRPADLALTRGERHSKNMHINGEKDFCWLCNETQNTRKTSLVVPGRTWLLISPLAVNFSHFGSPLEAHFNDQNCLYSRNLLKINVLRTTGLISRR